MTVRTFLWGALISMVASWAIVTAIILWVDPVQVGWVALMLLFLALFLGVASTGALVGYGMRRVVLPRQLPAWRLRPSLRQGVLLGMFTVILLVLQFQRLLYWWISVILVVLFVILEFFFISYDRSSGRSRE